MGPEMMSGIFNIANNISSAAVPAISIYRDYLRVTPLTNDNTPLNYNSIFNEKKIQPPCIIKIYKYTRTSEQIY